jgi:hypothetical protein
VDGGLDVRITGINPERWKYGAFNDLHEMACGADFAESIKRAACAHYGWAGRHFLERLCAELEKGGEAFLADLRGRHAAWIEAYCPNDCDGQVRRVAARFALAAVAGGLASEWGIVPYGPSETTIAAVDIFKAWHRDRGPGSHESRAAVDAVRDFINAEGPMYFPAPDDKNPRHTKTYGLRVQREQCVDDNGEVACLRCRCEAPNDVDGTCSKCEKPMACPKGETCKCFDWWLRGKRALEMVSGRPLAQAKKALIAEGIMEPWQQKWKKASAIPGMHSSSFYVIKGDKLIAADADNGGCA